MPLWMPVHMNVPVYFWFEDIDMWNIYIYIYTNYMYTLLKIWPNIYWIIIAAATFTSVYIFSGVNNQVKHFNIDL